MTDLVQVELIRGVVSVAGNFVIATPAIIAAFLCFRALKAVHEVHEQGKKNFLQMDGRMEELLKYKGEASEALGIVLGEKKERARAKGH